MAYATGNPQTKKKLKEAIAAGREIFAYINGGMFPSPRSCDTTIEGPQFPKPHRWYARVTVDENGRIVKVIS